jgi:hypothetical protein
LPRIKSGYLSVADDEQDDAFIGFRDYVKAFTNNSDAEKQAAANILLDVKKLVGRYGVRGM